jgi:coproporphyrinogen III oxidase
MYKFSKKKWLDNKSNGSANPLEFKYGMIFEKSNLNS